MKEFISLLERKIEGCDALGGLEREKAVYQSVLKDYKKQLNLCGVVKSFYCYDNKYCGVNKKCDKQCENCELIEND